MTPEPETVATRVRRIIEQETGADLSRHSDDATIGEDLGADSLDRVELVMELEREFGVNISDDDHVAFITTVGSTVAYFERKAGVQ